MSETRSAYLKHAPERDPDDVRDERIDAELARMFDDIELSTQVEILEQVLRPQEEACIICGEEDMWDERFCYYCAKEHYA